MIAPDTSVLVAGFVADHPFRDAAESALVEVRDEGCLVAHTLAETYSVLSAPAGVYRVPPDTVKAYLDGIARKSALIQPRPDAYKDALGLLSDAGRGGGAIYDALIAMAVRDAGAGLISLDRRAERIYALCGIEARILPDT